MVEVRDRCPACGYPRSEGACTRCGGRVRSPRDGRAPRCTPGVPLRDLVEGFVSPFAGALTLLHDRPYIGKLALPVLVNLLVLSLAFAGMFWGFWELFDGLFAVDGADWGFLDFLRPLVTWAGGAAALVLSAVALWILAPVLIETVTGPFLDPLAEATETAWADRAMPALRTGVWRSAAAGAKGAAHVLAWQLILLIPLLLLSLTGVGALIAAVVAAWLNALIWFDVPCSRRGYGLRERSALLRRNWARAVGFGLGFQVGMFVPFFNLLLLTPAAAVATSAQYFRFDKRPRAGGARGRA
jgi:uncharacterized protein involved in cysteine biosynthesis